jgi:hypothetical protein
MAQVYHPESTPARRLALPLKANFTTGVLAFLFIVTCSFLTFYRVMPPSPVSANAAATDFSSGRAMEHLKVISRKPHPVGVAEHAVVRDYIMQQLAALGLEPQVQKTTVANKLSGSIRVATVENIAARLKGTGGDGKAVMLVGHYDTVSISPGAGDDGSSVAAILETVRALKGDAPPRNDLIFLFTDGEELGLLGARAFIDEHPWRKDVGLVLNFEARGASGPAIMFETSNGNGRLIQEFARSVKHPSANSLAYEIYRVLPNDTDLTVFKEAKLPGFNFANIDGFTRYHTHSDSVENLDEGTLQHKGAYALALARHFGNVSLNEPSEGNAIYFDLLGATVLHYPATLVMPLTIFVALLFVAVGIYGWRKGRLTPGGIIVGFLSFILTMALAYGVVLGIWWLNTTIQGWFGNSLQDDFYRSKLYLLGFLAITIALSTALYNLFLKKIRIENLAFGGLLCWLLLLVVVSVLIPGGSYILTWPLLFSLISLALMFRAGESEGVSTKRFIIMSLCAIPGIILLVPMVYLIFVALGLAMVAAAMVLVALLFGLLIPYFSLMTSSRKWLLPGGAAVAGVLLLVFAALTASFDRLHPKADNVSYIQNTDLGKAVWASTDGKADEWTKQFFSGTPEVGSLMEYIPTNYKGFLQSPAPFIPLPQSDIKVLDDQTANGVRTLRLSINSAYPTGYMTAPTDANTEVLAATIKGQRYVNEVRRSTTSSNSWALNYYAPPAEGFELTLEVNPAQPLKLRVVDQAYELPQIPGASYAPRPEHIMPAPFTNSDTTQVSRTYTF